jgi:hypothetical protein
MVKKRYHAPAATHQRLLGDARVLEEVRARVRWRRSSTR